MARILVVDDDELVGEAVRAILEGEGHVVGVVTGGKAALAAIAAKQFDLVILDSMMPDLPGSDVLHAVRTSLAHFATPILMLTARRADADVDIAMRAGADDYLKKPFDPDMLVVRVESLLASGRRRHY